MLFIRDELMKLYPQQKLKYILLEQNIIPIVWLNRLWEVDTRNLDPIEANRVELTVDYTN